MSTMSEIAKTAGVSRYTVSKVLNGAHVAEETYRKVMEACEKHHYTRNLLATNLVRNHSSIIGMVLAQDYDSFFGEIINAAEKEAAQQGYQLICQCSHGDPREEEKIIRSFESLRVCGMVAAPVTSNDNRERWEHLDQKMPLIHFDCFLNEASHYVISDNRKSAGLITEHLIKRKTAPAYLGSAHSNANLAVKERCAGYIDTVTQHGLPPLFIPTSNSGESVDNQKFGIDNIEAFLETNPLPASIFCATDRIAMGVIFALQKKGIEAGTDVLVAGHDDLEFGKYMNPTLTTVAQPKTDIGAECVRTLFDLLNKPQPREQRVQKVLPPELIIRQSTSPK